MVLMMHLSVGSVFCIYSKSSVMNGGFSTGYFELNRDTRQGDPLAPNLLILIIEILIAMVQENEKIKKA